MCCVGKNILFHSLKFNHLECCIQNDRESAQIMYLAVDVKPVLRLLRKWQEDGSFILQLNLFFITSCLTDILWCVDHHCLEPEL